jgi:hypothetical protein
MRKTNVLAGFIFIALSTITLFPQSITALKNGFQSPPADSRIMMRWWWFGPAVTRAEIERELRVMRDGGIGGVEVQPVYPLLPDDPKTGYRNLPYLSDEFLAMLKFTAMKTKELGMRFDLTLGSGWSFGGAKTPITEAAGQLRIERVKLDAGTPRVPVPSMIPAEKFLSAFLSPRGGNTFVENDLTRLTDIRDGAVYLPSDARSGSEVLFFIAGKSGMQVKRPSVGSEGYVLNHLDKPSVDSYLKQTGDRLFSAFGPSQVPFSVFCDSLEVYHQDWTDDFDAEFQRRRGYDIKNHLPKLVGEAKPESADVRYDWGRTITELFDERFMIPMQAWSKRNGTKFRIQGYGIPAASISSNKWADISDGEGAQWKVVRAARWAASANHIYGRKVTSSETWTWLNSPVFRATPLDLKAEADIHFLQGINQLIGHGWGYTPPGTEYPGWRFYAAGAYSEQNPWWIVMPDLAKYLQRLSYILRQGEPQNDVALYMPTADAYTHFRPGSVHLIEGNREIVGEKIMPSIFKAGYNLDFFDDEVLRTVGKSANGVLTLGSSEHRVVVLPNVERMPLATLKKLDAFVQSGGKIVAARKIPSRVPGLTDSAKEQREFDAIASRLFRSNASVKFVENDEDTGDAIRSFLQPDVRVEPATPEIHSVHRKTAAGDIFFIANTTNERKKVEISLRVAGGKAEIWDPMSGQTTAAELINAGPTSTTIAMEFEPYGSTVVVVSPNGTGAPTLQKTSPQGNAIDLGSDWSVRLGNGPATPFRRLDSWAATDAGKFFSGQATYEKSFDVNSDFLVAGRSAMLDFGQGEALKVENLRNGMRTWYDPPIREAAVIYVNGQKAGSLWAPPYRLDVTRLLKTGSNSLRIVVGNTALNHMAGRRLPDYRLLNLRYGERFQPQEMEKIQSLPSGIIGSLTLRAYRVR